MAIVSHLIISRLSLVENSKTPFCRESPQQYVQSSAQCHMVRCLRSHPTQKQTKQTNGVPCHPTDDDVRVYGGECSNFSS